MRRVYDKATRKRPQQDNNRTKTKKCSGLFIASHHEKNIKRKVGLQLYNDYVMLTML